MKNLNWHIEAQTLINCMNREWSLRRLSTGATLEQCEEQEALYTEARDSALKLGLDITNFPKTLRHRKVIPTITSVYSLEGMFGLPHGTVLKTTSGQLVGVYYAPQKQEGETWYEWNVVEREDDGYIIHNQVHPESMSFRGDGTVKLSVPWSYRPGYKKNGGPLHRCYNAYNDFLTRIGILEATGK